MREKPKLRPCLKCGRLRKSTHVGDRLHGEGKCSDGGATFSPAEKRRIDLYLARWEFNEPKPKPGPKPKPKAVVPKREPKAMPVPKPKATPAPKRERVPRIKPVPTEAEVLAMTVLQRADHRQRLRKRGLPLPAYLVPLGPRACAAMRRAKA